MKRIILAAVAAAFRPVRPGRGVRNPRRPEAPGVERSRPGSRPPCKDPGLDDAPPIPSTRAAFPAAFMTRTRPMRALPNLAGLLLTGLPRERAPGKMGARSFHGGRRAVRPGAWVLAAAVLS